MKKLLATACLSVACVSANAETSFMNGLTLVTHLHGGPLSLMAVGYIMGLADADEGKLYCLPSGMDHMTLAHTVAQSVPSGKTGPHESLYQPAPEFVRSILKKAYPCRR